MNSRIRWMIAMTALLLLGALNVQGLIPDDADGDGVADSVDVCPAEDASGFDRDGDGCIDDAIGARHVEYWSTGDPVVTYVINQSGAPGVAGNADNNAVIAAFDAWTSIPGTGLAAAYGGTTAQSAADGLDHVNLVTFVDNSYPFGMSTLAVGISTSFESDTLIDGRVWRKGEIYDADMIFSPTKTFKAGGAGPGTDIQSVATHEAGHLFGISHTAMKSATMYYVLPGGEAARTLAGDDQRVYYKGYATPASLAGASRLKGEVRDGQSNDPVPGAVVFAIHAASGDTAACEITLPDGSFDFAGLAAGDYHVAIHPLDGTSNIGYLQAGNINAYVASFVDADFLPEYWDNAESNGDIAGDRDPVAVSAGATASIEIVTNIDGTAPMVLEVKPAPGSPEAAIDGAFLVRFSERVDVGTIASAFSFRSAGGGVGGNLSIIRDDSVVVFTPTSPLDFETGYTLKIDTDLLDRAGNAIAGDYTASYTTAAEPPLSITSLAPNKGVPGTSIVINGRGFSTAPAPAVDFNGTAATVVNASPGRLVVVVPDGVTTGNVVVSNPDLEVSNALVFTALSDQEIARGYESGTVTLANTPHAIALSPDGNYAYIAAKGGVEAVVVNAGLGGYLTRQLIADPAEFTDIAVSADGRRAYAVSPESDELIEIVTDPTAGLLFNTIIATRALNAEPRGIVTDPFGFRAYIATDAAEVQVWDTRLGSPTYNEQVGVLHAPDGVPFAGAMAITPDGARLLAPGSNGEVFFYDLGPDTLVHRVPTAPDPRAIAIDPQGQRAYLAHGDGTATVLNLAAAVPFYVQGIATGGSLRGLDTTPAGLYLYATDRVVDNLKIVDLEETSVTFRSVIATAPMAANPVDIAMSADGIYAFSVLQGDAPAFAPRMVVTTIGQGPTIRSMVPQAGQPGTKIVITGSGLANLLSDSPTEVSFNGTTVAVDFSSPSELQLTVPAGATSGPAKVRVPGDTGTQESNAIFFEVIGPASPDQMRLAAQLEFPNTAQLFCDYTTPIIAFSPDGSYLYVACGGGDFCFVFDIRPGSPQFNQIVGNFTLGGTPRDVAITADGKMSVWAVDSGARTFYCDPNDPRFGTRGPDIDYGAFMGGAAQVATSPDNRHVVILDGSSWLLVDAAGLSDGVTPVVVQQIYPFAVGDKLRFHPTGRAAYVINVTGPSSIIVLNTDPNSPNYTFSTSIAVNRVPSSIDVSRDGQFLYVLHGDPSPNFAWGVQKIDVSSPNSPVMAAFCPMGLDAAEVSNDNLIRIAPQGTFAIRRTVGVGFRAYDPSCPVTQPSWLVPAGVGTFEYEFTPDGRRIYAAGPSSLGIRMYDFAAAENLTIASGNNQQGVTQQLLPAPLRIQVTTSQVGRQLDGIPVTFEAQNNGRLLAGNGFQTKVIVATDASGFAEVQWKLGDLGANTVQVTATGLSGSPLAFTATAGVDPETLPLAVSEVIPLDGATGVSPTTALLATFSRAVDRATVAAATLYLRNPSTTSTVATTYGFTDTDRKVSLTPTAALDLGTVYELVLTAGIEAVGGSPLSNPGTSAFTVAGTVDLRLAAVSPPSALAGVGVVLSGTGFDPQPADNVVLFNNVATTPISGGPGSLAVVVPRNAIPGTIRVVANADTSEAIPFTVLVPNTSPIDEVIASVGTSTGAKSCAISPDGALIYTLGTDGDVVIPVDVEGQSAYASIPVGDQPVAIVIHPDGRLAYVANFGSGTVSVIDIDPASANFNKVVTSIRVGTNPNDLAVDPDGSRIAVANAGSSDVSIVDTNGTSETYNEVVSTVGTSTGAKSVAISPDGTIYVGTDTGFVVIDASNQVVASVGTATGAKSVVISPDGTLLYILTTDGTILVVDIQDGSPSENQVVATVGTGTGAKSVALSPDGTLLYIIPESGDVVMVIAIEVIPGVSARNPDGAAPSFTFVATPLDTVEVGSDPNDVAVDPSGSGLVVVANTGDATVSLINGSSVPVGALLADVEVTPSTLNLQSNGKYVGGSIELPAGYFAEEIVFASIRLQGVIPAVPGSGSILDKDTDGVNELHVKFDRASFQAILPQGEQVPVTISGVARGRPFAGEDTIRTIRPTVTHPHAAQHLAPGEHTYIAWTNPAGPTAAKVDVHFSADNGATWSAVVLQATNTGSVAWTAPNGFFDRCRVMVTLWRDGAIYGQGMNQEPFTITAPVPTRLKSFDIAVEDGAAVLRWETGVELGMEGFHVVRATSQTGVYEPITEATIPAGGEATGSRYEFRDEDVVANRTYWYKLREVTPDGVGMEFGPYAVTYRLAYGLEQNVPNPFNPSTTIKYALAADGPVTLTVYDVNGARVRELVNESQRADVHRVTWDGYNDAGQRVASGMYFYKLVAGKYTQTKKMMLLK